MQTLHNIYMCVQELIIVIIIIIIVVVVVVVVVVAHANKLVKIKNY